MAHQSNQKVTTGTAVRIISSKLEMLNSNIEKCVRHCKEQGCPLECNTVTDKGQWYPLEQNDNDKGAALMSNRMEVNIGTACLAEKYELGLRSYTGTL